MYIVFIFQTFKFLIKYFNKKYFIDNKGNKNF